MTQKKIAIIGKGTAGSQAALHFSRYLPDEEIVWYFDPSKPAQAVGEGSTLSLPKNLFNTVGFTFEDLKKVNGTFKTGIKKVNWGTYNKEYFHNFTPPAVSYHFNAIELQEYVEKLLGNKVKIISESVDFNDVDADFVFNASGAPKEFDDFNKSEYIPVNAAYITQCFWDKPEFDYTLTIAGKYGWIFGIPLQNRCSIGYLYNSSINTEEEVAEDVKQVFEKYKLNPSNTTASLNFNNYSRKENFQKNGNLVHSGNASFFLEPIEATSIGFMDRIQRGAFDIWTGNIPVHQANYEYLIEVQRIELVIMMHYAAGSPFKTEFWEFAKERGIKKLESYKYDSEFRHLYSSIKDMTNMHEAVGLDIKEFGSWWPGSFVQNIQGLGLKQTMDELFLD